MLPLSTLIACTSVEQGYVKPPLVYRIDIQQGNEITQAMLNKLRVGMDERQVKFIMGTPLLIDPFHPDRWEYLYFNQEGGDDAESRHISLYFKDKKLSHIKGDVKVSFLPIQDDEKNTEKSVNVPKSYGYRGLLDKWFDDKPELNKKTKEKFESIVNENIESEKNIEPEIETIADTRSESDTTSEITQSDIINDVDSGLDIEDTKTDDVVTSEGPVDGDYSLKAEDEESGFFSKMWDKITNDEPDYEFLEPKTQR